MGEGLISDGRWVIGSVFVLSLLAFVAIGILSSRHKKESTDDYLLAGRDVNPWLVALSAIATMNSGFMFIGQIGFTYRVGFSSVWMLVGWTIGDFVAWRYFYKRLREESQDRDEISALALLRPRGATGRRYLVPIAGLLTVFYLSMYAAAQLKAGSTALHSTFGTPLGWGAIIGALIVVVYCFSGGIRASIWTDAAQSIVMFGAMAILVFLSFFEVGGVDALFSKLTALDPSLVSLIPEDPLFGFGLYVLGMCLGGFGVIGQPHLLVRSMCISDASQIKSARRYYFAFIIPFYAFAIGVGVHARVLLPDLATTSPLGSEGALPMLSVELLPDVLIGVMLAGLFSATMSTADSQIIACTSAISQDIAPRWKDSYLVSKLSTVGFTLVALAIALSSSDRVFGLVLDAWAVLSCTLGPLMIVTLLRWPYSRRMGLVMLVVGFVVANLWSASSYADDLYVNLPGMAAAFAAYGIMLLVGRVRTALQTG